MNKISEIIEEFLKDFKLNNPEYTYLAAFSGGYDSMCLLDNLRKISKNKIIAIHLNHNWRGEESDREEQNCKEYCQKTGIKFYSEKLPSNIPKTETEARNERYKFFERCAEKFNSNIIFTAHNKNDNVETIIFRLCHGTGISGLCGIKKHRGIFYRPLLDVSRKEIENYCQNNNLTPNFDSSNNDNIHKRNLIRSEILPLMNKISPDILNSVSSLINIANEETQMLEEYTDETIKKISDGNKIRTKDFFKLSNNLQKRILYKIISGLIPDDYSEERIIIVLKFLEGNKNSKSGKKISVTKNYWMFINSEYFETITINSDEKPYFHITKEGEYKNGGYVVNISPCNRMPDEGYGDSGGAVFLNLQGLEFDFEIRQRKQGDIIQPFGMSGHQKLKKYLNSKKIPNHEKDELLFFTQNNEVLWAVNIGISEKARVKENPTHKIMIRREENE